MGKTLSDLKPAIKVVTDFLDSDFSAKGTGLLDKAESVKAELGPVLTGRITKFQSFYDACDSTGPDLTDNQFIDMQVEAQRLKDELDKVLAKRKKPSKSTALRLFLFVVAAFAVFAFIKANG